MYDKIHLLRLLLAFWVFSGGALLQPRKRPPSTIVFVCVFLGGGVDIVTTDKSFSEIQFGGYQTLVFHVALCSTLMIYLKTVFEA